MRVSICIPVYENPEGLKNLLQSCLAQTFQDFEVIITDDSKASCEGSSLFAPFEGRLTYVHHEKPFGAPANWNAAIALAKGQYVKIMHGDDSFTDKDSLQRFVDLLDKHPEADLAFSGSRQLENGKTLKDRFMPPEDIDRFQKDYRLIYTGNTIGAPSAVIVRREAIQKYGITYDEKLTWLVDSDYYMQILQRNPHFAYTKAPLVSIGESVTQLTKSVGNDKDIVRREYRYVYGKFDLNKVPACEEKLAAMLAQYPEKGDTAESLHLDQEIYKKAKRAEHQKRVQRRLDTNEYLYGKALGLVNRGPLRKFWNLCYLVGFLIELAIVIVDKSAITNPYESYLFRGTMLLFALKAFFGTRYDRRERIFFFFALVLSVISYGCSGRNALLRYTVFLMATLGMDLKKVMKLSFFGTLLGCILLAVLSLTGVLGTVTITEVIDGTEPVTRLVLGMGHPNSMYCMYMVVILLGLYIWWDKVKIWQICCLFVLNFILYGAARAALPFIVLCAALFGALTKKCRFWKKNVVYALFEVLFAVGLVLCIAGAIVDPSTNTVLSLANRVMTGRIAALWDTIYNEGTIATWTLFSSPENSYYFDLGFIRFFYWYGLIPGIALIWLIFEIFRSIRLHKDARSEVFFGVLILYTLFEAHLISVYIGRNVLLFVAAAYLPKILNGSGESVPL